MAGLLRAVFRWVAMVMAGVTIVGVVLSNHADAELRITPYLNFEEEYTDNFFRSEQQKAEFWITQIAPGLSIEALSDKSRFNFDYTLSYFIHDDVGGKYEDASGLDYTGHLLYLSAATRLGTRITLGIDENYILTREPAQADIFYSITNRDKFWRNRLSPFISYDISNRGAVKLGYRNEVFNYIGNPSTIGREDSTENRGIVTLTYNLNSRNHLDLENQYWRREYDGGANSDYSSYQAKLIFRREFNSEFEGRIGAGYQVREFDEAAFDSKGSFTFNLGLSRQTDVSKIDVFFERNLNDFTVDNDYFEAYLFKVTGEYLLWDVVRAYAGGFYQYADYVRRSRTDNDYNFFVGAGYLFLDKRLELSAEYGRTNRDSSQDGSDFTENVFFVRLRAHHDFGSTTDKKGGE